jgi:hypothetical protein
MLAASSAVHQHHKHGSWQLQPVVGREPPSSPATSLARARPRLLTAGERAASPALAPPQV